MPGRPPPRRPPPRPLVLLLLAAAPLAGCLRGTLPPRELYRLRPLPAASTAPATPRLGTPPLPPLTIEPYATPGVYAGPEIVYRVGDVRYGTYPNRAWAVPLGAMLAALTTEQLLALDGGPRRVEDGAGAGGARGLVWRGVVREFEEVDRERGTGGPPVSAAVRLDARLVRAADDSVLWQGSAQIERPVTPPDRMTAVVDGLADAAHQAIEQLVRDAEPAMRAEAARLVAARATP